MLCGNQIKHPYKLFLRVEMTDNQSLNEGYPRREVISGFFSVNISRHVIRKLSALTVSEAY